MNHKLILAGQVLFFAFLFCTVEAQQTYLYKFGDMESQGSIYQLVDDDNAVWLGTLNSTEPIFADIAVAPSGDLYGLSQDGSIRLINLDEGTTTEVGFFSAITVHTAFTCDSQSNFYTLDFFDNLVSYNIITHEETTIMAVGEITPGDLTFYNGRLVFPSGEGVLKTIDLETEEIESIYTLTPEMITLNDIWGIANSFHQCGNEQLIVSNFSNQLFKINVLENTFVELTPTYDTDAGGVIYGMTSSDDLLASDCDGFVGVSDTDISRTAVSFHPNPAVDFINVMHSDLVDYLEFINLDGQIIKTAKRPMAQLYVGDLTPGFYLIRSYMQEGNSSDSKLIILR